MAGIPVMEIFPAIQGEGMVCGQKTVFLRTAFCDFSCIWCDSKFTWDGSEKENIVRMSPEEILAKMDEEVPAVDGKRNFSHVTISGGNPALIGRPMSELIDLLHSQNIKVGLETQGSVWKEWFYKVDDLTISPKPPSSLMPTDFVILSNMVSDLRLGKTNFSLKVVVFDDEDFEYAKKVHKLYPEVPFFLSVGNEDANEEGDISGRLIDKLGWLWDKVIADPDMNDARPLPQLHTLVYANRRKV